MPRPTTITEALGFDLDAVRQRMGWNEGMDPTSYDERINKLEPRKVVELWCGWHLGYESWGEKIIDLYERVRRINKL